jgi:hypothetical protein
MSGKRRSALIAGISLIVMAVAAGFSYGYVFGNVIIEGDPAETYNRLTSMRSLYFAGLAGWIVIFIADLVVAWTLYLFFRDVNRNLSLMTALVRFAYAAFLGLALVQLFRIIPVVQGAAGEEAAGLEILDFAGTFARIWSVGLMVFGIHLLGLGRLSMRSGSVPRWLAILLLFAGASYFLLHFARSVIPASENVVTAAERVLSIPMALGEILLAFWLIIRGGKERKVE